MEHIMITTLTHHEVSKLTIVVVIRALAQVLMYPITRVQKVTKRTIYFNNNAAPAAPVAPAIALPVPAEAEIIPAEPEPIVLAELLGPVDAADTKTAAWEEERFAMAILAYLLLVRHLSRARVGFRVGRAPPRPAD